MKEFVLTNLGTVEAPLNVTIKVSTVRHDNDNQPSKVTMRTPIEIVGKDGSSSFCLGRLPLSEFRTKSNPYKRGEVMKCFFTQLEITVVAPLGIETKINCFSKKFYPKPGSLKELLGFRLGKEVIFSQRFPVEHLGKTSQSRVGTNQNRNNIYVCVSRDNMFVTYAVAVNVQENGVWLTYAPVYTGEVFRDNEGVRCPLLEDEKTGGTRETFLPLVKRWFTDAKLSPVPEGFEPHPRINVSGLKNGGNGTGTWSEVLIHMESPARQLSFGLAKEVGTGKALFVYANWEEIAGVLPDKRIKRIPFGSVVRGWMEPEEGGRFKLTKVQFLPQEQAAEKWRTAHERGEQKGASFQDPEWLQKRKARIGHEANLGQQFAGLLEELEKTLHPDT